MIKRVVLYIISLWSFCYLLGSFVEVTFNLSNWSKDVRYIMGALITFGMCMLAPIIDTLNKKKDE